MTPTEGILDRKQTEKQDEIVGMLTKACWMEIETAMSYIASLVNPDGMRAQEITEGFLREYEAEGLA